MTMEFVIKSEIIHQYLGRLARRVTFAKCTRRRLRDDDVRRGLINFKPVGRGINTIPPYWLKCSIENVLTIETELG